MLNDLVPRAYPEHMRADIIQEMMLAVIEGKFSIDEIKSNRDKSAWFIKKFWKDNYEVNGHGISFDQVHDGWRTAEVRVAAQEWHQEQFAERTRFADSFSRVVLPTQIDDVWNSQVREYAQRFELSFDEAAEVLTLKERN